MNRIEDLNCDQIMEKWIQENDDSKMPLPDLEFEPHLLISKVRKHYMEYLIKSIIFNYENHQKLLNKNIYLPSAIWRCAKLIETTAAQTSMVVNLYRRNILTVINQLKADTNKGKLNKNLFECLKKPPENEKKSQTTLTMGKDCTCVCTCYQRKRVRNEKSPVLVTENRIALQNSLEEIKQVEAVQPDGQTINTDLQNQNISLPYDLHGIDNVMLQLDQLFEDSPNDEDIFDGTFDISIDENRKKLINVSNETHKDNSNIDNNAAQNKSLNNRLSSLSEVMIQVPAQNTSLEANKKRKQSNKWICEEYFMKVKLFELLDQLRDCNRAKLSRIKELLSELFGDDSDDEGVMSPLEETPEFIISCKERIAPWVVKLLTPHYIKGRIQGKALFKSLAKHLIRLIFQCSKYPEEYEVQDFIRDFLSNHNMIRCEADFQQFRIENI